MAVISNPIIWADIPDNDVIRVGNAFYMVSTSMHMMPGCPIMKSYDLKNWETVSYVFGILSEKDANNLENGTNIYGKGSWAASLRHKGDYFYCLFNSNDDRHAYLFRTRDIEASEWERYPLPRYMHDPSLLLDDDGRNYILYGNNDIFIAELSDDLLSLKVNGPDRLLFRTEEQNMLLKAEGCHAYKINGRYYAIFIEWTADGNNRRREVCYRFDSFEGPFEHRVILDDDMGYHNAGVAQGAIFDLPDDADIEGGNAGPDGRKWAAVMFQDHGAVGRIPFALPVYWEDGWPMLGINGKVPESFELKLEAPAEALCSCFEGDVIVSGDLGKGSAGIWGNDEFRRLPGEERSLADTKHPWQWNHNPDDALWSLSERPGWLRLVNGHISEKGILQARNTLTQRTFGPKCAFETHLDISGMKDGDCAGMAALQGHFALIGVRVEEDKSIAVMCVNDGEGGEKTVFEQPLNGHDIYLRIAYDFVDNRDVAELSFSEDGEKWIPAGSHQLKYTLDHFMGCRTGLYSYCTQRTGGFADFGYFHIKG